MPFSKLSAQHGASLTVSEGGDTFPKLRECTGVSGVPL
jgi:hypothetical protein